MSKENLLSLFFAYCNLVWTVFLFVNPRDKNDRGNALTCLGMFTAFVFLAVLNEQHRLPKVVADNFLAVIVFLFLAGCTKIKVLRGTL